MRRAPLGLLLVCVIGLAGAQTTPEKPEERRPLNLKLDNPSSWATTAPEPEKERDQNLPTLGADARPVPQTVQKTPEWGSNSPIPKDSNPGR
jgi:hypothetical protein